MVNGVSLIPLSGMNFDPACSRESGAGRFSEFVAGPENALAAAVLQPFLACAPTHASPLVLYGPHGCGKSHLALGLAELWHRHYPHIGVVCSGGADFARQYAAAAADGRLAPWRAEVRSAGLFVVDDLGELGDKRPAQQELLRTLDALDDSGALAVVTARSLPSHWPVLLPALRGRLSAGLVVPLAYPARGARRVILERLAAARNVAVSARALDCLADGLEGSVPALVAALLELEVTGARDRQPVDAKSIRQFVAGRSGAPKPTLREIGSVTAKYFALKLSDLKSPARRRSLVVGRGVAMFLARQLTANSLEQIGSFFGGRDHTTVLHACRRTEKLLRRDRTTRIAVAELLQLLAPV